MTRLQTGSVDMITNNVHYRGILSVSALSINSIACVSDVAPQVELNFGGRVESVAAIFFQD